MLNSFNLIKNKLRYLQTKEYKTESFKKFINIVFESFHAIFLIKLYLKEE